MNTIFDWRRMVWALVAVALLLVVSTAWREPASQPIAAGVAAVVLSIPDGDTLTVRVGGKRERVRVLGIDTPEMNYDDGTPDCGAVAATQWLRTRIASSRVTLLTDPREPDRDRYERLLRYLQFDGSDIGGELIDAGLAAAYRRTSAVRRADYLQREGVARAAGRGSWGECGRL